MVGAFHRFNLVDSLYQFLVSLNSFDPPKTSSFDGFHPTCINLCMECNVYTCTCTCTCIYMYHSMGSLYICLV